MVRVQRTAEVRVSVESVVDEDTARRFHELYKETFQPLAVKAVQRHLLHEHEFMDVMSDERVDKYLVWDANGEALAMCTLTNHLETVTLISPEYFAHHYPEHTARNAVYYLGFSLVAPGARREQLFSELISRVTETLVERRAMCAYDICNYNNEALNLSDAVVELIGGTAEIDVQHLDAQNYYAAVATGPLKEPKRLECPNKDLPSRGLGRRRRRGH